MRILFTWLIRITGGAILLAMGAVALAYYLASGSLPDYDKRLPVTGISAPVEIVRDTANVPHILGATDADTFFGLGYAHAQDRLWQMTILRRTVQGRLSEVFGTRTQRIDTLMRRFDLYRLAQQSVEAQDAFTRMALDAYAAGVNARLEEINRDALGRGAPEMFFFNAPIAPWVPADSVALIKIMGVQLSGHLQAEVKHLRTALALPDAERIADILPVSPGAGVAALPEYASLFGDVPRFAARQPEKRDLLNPVQPLELAGASNAFAAAPSRSAAGGTLLASDPHLGFSAPTIWYLARLQLSTGDVIGASLPGVPVIMFGRSAKLGWGLTSSYVDDQDVYLEKLNPDNPEEYLTPGGYVPFETRQSIIEIKDEPAITLTLRWTENGPVLPPGSYDLGSVTPPGHVASVAWTLLTPRDTTLSAALGMMRAQSVEEAMAAGEGFIAPSQMLTLVDRESIGMKLIGAVPRRNAGHRSQGRFPSEGWREENRWQGRMPYASNPQFLDPRGGIVGNTNNKVVERPFPNHLTFRWGDTQRVNRWQRLMQSREVHTRESFIEAQLDPVSFTARSLLPLVGADLWFTGESAPEGTPERQRQRALTLLAEWNGQMNEHLPEPLIYAAWLRALQERLIRDELGPVADDYSHVDPIFIERVYRNIEGAGIWCDVIQSAPVETCTDMARLALDDALVWIAERYGTQLESLRWGDAHQATHDHPTLGGVPVLRYFMNIRQSTSGGDNTMLRGRTSGEGPDPFLNVHGAAYRGVYDFTDPDSSVFITSTGQSGHFLSRHYDDLAQLWRRGEYIPMSLDIDLARAGAVGTTVLDPAQ